MDENDLGNLGREFLGTDRKGFTYWKDENDRYVYQRYADRDYFVRGQNMRSEWVGWICTVGAWERTFHRMIER